MPAGASVPGTVAAQRRASGWRDAALLLPTSCLPGSCTRPPGFDSDRRGVLPDGLRWSVTASFSGPWGVLSSCARPPPSMQARPCLTGGACRSSEAAPGAGRSPTWLHRGWWLTVVGGLCAVESWSARLLRPSACVVALRTTVAQGGLPWPHAFALLTGKPLCNDGSVPARARDFDVLYRLPSGG